MTQPELAGRAELAVDPASAQDAAFRVELANFSGPFDLLLSLISKRELEITEVALAQVTDEFIAFMRHTSDLSQTTEFLVVAATLLDMKARSLLPVDNESEDLDFEYLEARDLLFSRLLQYKAFKQVAAVFSRLMVENSGVVPREVGLDPQYAKLLPELKWTTTKDDLARFALEALTRTPPTVTITHLHEVLVPVAPQKELLQARLRLLGSATFTELCADTRDTNMIVARFLALLELYREAKVSFEQAKPLEPFTVYWL